MKKTEETLAQVVKKALEMAEKTGDFIVDQTPQLIQEFYRWQISKNIFTIIICLILFYFIKKLFRKLLEIRKEENEEVKNGGFYYDQDNSGFVIYFLFFVSGVLSIFTMVSIYKLGFIFIAPKLYLIEYFIKK